MLVQVFRPMARQMPCAMRCFSDFPANFKYTSDHEWMEAAATAKTGISDFAQEELGDIVYVDLPNVRRMAAPFKSASN